jgi:hypothetical protein
LRCAALVAGSLTALTWSVSALADDQISGWSQWGQNSQHQGNVAVEGQPATSILADKIYDPFTAAEEDCSGGDLLAHYQVPLLDGSDVFMEFKTGTFSAPACDWQTQIWNERALTWDGTSLVDKWNFVSDWKPEPQSFASWEPVFHAVLANGTIYVPGLGGSIFKVDKASGANMGRINPFAPALDPNTYVAGPLSADVDGNIYYNALKLGQPGNTLVDSWLVKVTAAGAVSKVTFGALLAPANLPTTCIGAFPRTELPWPRGTVPSSSSSPADPAAVPASGPCGGQRPGLNIAPAIAPDGTVYTASRAHLNSRYSYLVAVNPDLTLQWAASLRDRVSNGCGVLVPVATQAAPVQKGKCRWNATLGVDPETNQKPAGRINDAGTASPTVLPDGNIVFGGYTRYNAARGNLFKFSPTGDFQTSFDFGWDDTVAVVPRENNTYSIVMKDNHYDEELGYYCNRTPSIPVSMTVCDFTGIPAGPFYITQVDSNLNIQWQFKSTETRNCHRNPDGTVTCINDGLHPNGFEWCINAPAVDSVGNVYVESEDGFFYVLDQTHSAVFTTPKYKIFTNLAVGAAYTPFSIDALGRLYAQNNGHLFVIGAGGEDAVAPAGNPSTRSHTPKRLDPELET